MPVSQPAYFNLQEFSDGGVLLVGGRLYTYTQGTTTLKVAYTDAAGAVPQTYTADGLGGQYIALDARGELPAPLYLAAGSYDIALKRADGSTVWTRRADGVDNTANTGFAALLSSIGSSLIGFIQAGVGAVLRTVQAKLRDTVSPKDFGCVIDGVTDDTIGWNACVLYAMTNGYKIRHPGGWIRLTSGYTTVTAFHNLFIEGAGRSNELNTPITSGFLLDSADPSSFFYTVDHNSTTCIDGIAFKCAQYVAERRYFHFTAGLHCEFFTRCTFEAVERPIVWAAGSYFQNASFRDVQFRNSGTFHSEGSAVIAPTSLIGTHLVLDNVNHEGSVPVNAEMIVCNLRGIRQIDARTLLLEGALPAAGWTILHLNNPYDTYYTRQSMAIISSCHSEWSGAFAPTYVVEQVGGLVKFDYLSGLTPTAQYRISQGGKAIIEEAAFAADLTYEATLMFSLADNTSIVQLESCSARTLDMTKAGYVQKNMQWATTTNGQGQVIVSNDAAQEIYRWNGGIFDGDQAILAHFGGSTSVYSTDAAYGRKLVITPNVNAVNTQITLKTASMLVPGDQLVMCVRARLPTFTGGQWSFLVVSGGASISTKLFDTTFSGAYVDVLMPVVLLTTPTTIGFNFTNGTATGVAGTLEILSMVMYHGNSVPRREVPCYPRNTISYASAMPTTGTWKQGDIVINTAKAVGQPKAWDRITTGSGNVLNTDWVSEGNL